MSYGGTLMSKVGILLYNVYTLIKGSEIEKGSYILVKAFVWWTAMRHIVFSLSFFALLTFSTDALSRHKRNGHGKIIIKKWCLLKIYR